MENGVDPDDKACYEPSHLDLHCLQWYMFWSAMLKELNRMDKLRGENCQIVLLSFKKGFILKGKKGISLR